MKKNDIFFPQTSSRTQGPWSTPVLVMMAKPEMDINFAPIIKADGSLVGMWRDHYPGGHHRWVADATWTVLVC